VPYYVADQVGKDVDRQAWSFPDSDRVIPMLRLVYLGMK
jgi:hypothetical protein